MSLQRICPFLIDSYNLFELTDVAPDSESFVPYSTENLCPNWLEAPALFVVFGFFLGWTGLWLPIAIPLSIALQWRPPQPISVAQKLPLLASLYLLAPVLLWGINRCNGNTFADYGLPWNPTVLFSLTLGLLLGVAGLGILLVTQWKLGWIGWQIPQIALHSEPLAEGLSEDSEEPQPNTPTYLTKSLQAILTATLPLLALGILVSLIEELIFRGFLINQLQRDYTPALAASIASLIFAVLHLVWEGRENIPSLPGLWLMGMVLVLARWVDGSNLGLAWGLHAGWIWIIASLDAMQVITYTGRKTEWITGLDGKPLAGIMGILFLLGTGAVLWGLGLV